MADLIPASSASSAENPRAGGILILVLIYLGAAVGVLTVVALIMFFRMTKSLELRAFRAPSDSMCPTICLNERLIVGMDVFRWRQPVRGDVILFAHPPGGPRFLKRVVAVGGDKVEPGPANTILVNGKAVAWADVCGEPIRNVAPFAEPIVFLGLTVPQDSFFVVGDNLNQSLDSRYNGYGFVRRDQVQGQALLIYGSPGRSRIGCRVR